MLTYKKLMVFFISFFFLFCGCMVFANLQASSVVDDSDITTQVKAKMLLNPEISPSNIDIETKHNIVILSGKVRSANEAAAIIETAESVDGVKDVDGSMLVVQGDDCQKAFTDTIITAKVKGLFIREKVFGDRPLCVSGVKVETKMGVVYLSGHASSHEAANAIKVAKSVTDVARVVSKISS